MPTQTGHCYSGQQFTHLGTEGSIEIEIGFPKDREPGRQPSAARRELAAALPGPLPPR